MRDVWRWAMPILGPDRGTFGVAIIYGVGISLLSLATPISVQMLINSVANTALPAPLFTLSAVLFVLLMLSVVMSAFRTHLLELFRQRLFARQVAEITLRAVHARNPFFQDARTADLFNRYFEVMNIQKAVPSLLIGLFTILLQSAVGFVVTSLYHPIFLAFNLVFIAIGWLIWVLWARGAMTSAVALSHVKYDMAHWLESIAGSNGFYKSDRHIGFAIEKSEAMTAKYLAAYRRHFRYSFSQAVAFLTLYALASAGLLALGGWLVIQGQLSIGQLVAAELILSSIFYGTSQLGPYLDTFYDLVAAVEELALLRAIPQEESGRSGAAPDKAGDLALSDVRIGDLRLDLRIPMGSRLIAHADADIQRHFAMLLKRHEQPDSGFITLDGADLSTIDPNRLRSDVMVLNRVATVEATIFDYLDLASVHDTAAQIMTAIRLAGLEKRIGRLPNGIQTVLSATGWPLGAADLMRLKLASAWLRQPRILVLSPLFDMIPSDDLTAIVRAFQGDRTTVIYFTNRADPPEFGGYLWVAEHDQRLITERATFEALRNGGHGADNAVA
ncbi:MAG: ABC transporter ATP-binding protein [Sphingomonas sp.]